jgi:hypothetical protein
MYLHYEILLSGYKSIYLGESMPIESLKELKSILNLLFCFVFYSSTDRSIVNEYVQEMTDNTVR